MCSQRGPEQPLPFDEIRLFSPAAVSDLPADDRFTIEMLPAYADGTWWQTLRLAPVSRATPTFSSRLTRSRLGCAKGRLTNLE
jgi:hypothetical protein